MANKTRPRNAKSAEPLSTVTYAGEDRPALAAGEYSFDVVQKFSESSLGEWTNKTTYLVEAPRYSLVDNPILARYPERSAQGRFRHTLPSVVLADAKLPWLRAARIEDLGLRGVDPDGRALNAPWLQLCLFNEDEIISPPKSQRVLGTDQMTGALTVTIEEFESWQGQPAGILNLQNAGRLHIPTFEGNTALIKDKSQSCQLILLSARVVYDSLPTSQESYFLAHTKASQDNENFYAHHIKGRTPDLHAVLHANRLPSPTTDEEYELQIMHILSIEGYWQTLSSDAASREQLRAAAERDDVFAFLTLAHWTFQTGGPPSLNEQFDVLARNLAQDTTTGNPRALEFVHQSARQMYHDHRAPTNWAEARLKSGFMPVDFTLPSNERTFAWYRGPLVPVEVAPFDPKGENQPHAIWYSDSLIYDGNTGVFDLSYSAAWQAGRALSLANTALMAAWTRVLGYAQNTLEGEIIAQRRGLTTPKTKSATKRFLDLLSANPEELKAKANNATAKIPEQNSKISQNLHPLDTWSRDGNPFSTLKTAVTLKEVKDLLRTATSHSLLGDENSDLDFVISTISSLLQLSTLPSHHLFPDESYLPNESLVFFNLDFVWLGYLLDGALTIGLSNDIHQELYKILREKIWISALDLIFGPNFSADLLAKKQGVFASGVMLRSQIISAWDQLTLNASHYDQSTDNKYAPLEIWREETLAGGIKIVFYKDRIDHFILAPKAGRLENGLSLENKIALRNLDTNTAAIGTLLTPEVKIDALRFLRNPIQDQQTLSWWQPDKRPTSSLTFALAQALKEAGQQAVNPASDIPLSAQALAVQLICGNPMLSLFSKSVTS